MVTLDTLFAELRIIRQLVEARGAAVRLSRSDRAMLEGLLPAIVGAVGSAPFLARELLDAPAPGLRLVLCDMSARRLGRLFRRGEGVPLGGYVVERLSHEGGAVVWRVCTVVAVS